MTLPDERYRAVLAARHLLIRLMDPKETPRVPTEIRQQARNVLRHFPNPWDMDQASEGSPHIFQPRMEEVTKMFKQWEERKNNEA
jgi:hypothetical protein